MRVAEPALILTPSWRPAKSSSLVTDIYAGVAGYPVKDRHLGALALASFLVFVLLAIGVTYWPALQSWDLQAAQWANNLALGDLLNSILVNASLYGREYFWILLVAILFLLGDRKTKLVALGLCGVFVVGIVAGEVAKEVVARSRPWQYFHYDLNLCNCVVRTPIEYDYSFPSGHALIVSIGAVYTIITFRRKWLAGLLAVEAAVVCFSRVYTFEHFPTDVLAGVALGGAIAIGGYLVGRRYLTPLAARVDDYLVRLFRDGPLKV